MTYRRRILVLPVAAIVILGLVAYKLTRSYPRQAEVVENLADVRPAEPFSAYDPDNKPVRLGAYLGRHRIVLVFFDGGAGIGGDSVLRELRQNYKRLRSSGVIVLAISTALPQTNRKAFEQIGRFPFPVLSDPGLNVHNPWGRVDANGKPIPGLFIIDRAGNVAWKDGKPKPADNAEQTVLRIISAI